MLIWQHLEKLRLKFHDFLVICFKLWCQDSNSHTLRLSIVCITMSLHEIRVLIFWNKQHFFASWLLLQRPMVRRWMSNRRKVRVQFHTLIIFSFSICFVILYLADWVQCLKRCKFNPMTVIWRTLTKNAFHLTKSVRLSEVHIYERLIYVWKAFLRKYLDADLHVSLSSSFVLLPTCMYVSCPKVIFSPATLTFLTYLINLRDARIELFWT